jgi:hypothetical protein
MKTDGLIGLVISSWHAAKEPFLPKDPNQPAEISTDEPIQTAPNATQSLWERIRHLGLEPAVMRSLTLVATAAMMALVCG